MCVVFIFNFVFSVIRSVCWHLYIYVVKRRRPCFVGGAIEIPLIDWLIDWFSAASRRPPAAAFHVVRHLSRLLWAVYTVKSHLAVVCKFIFSSESAFTVNRLCRLLAFLPANRTYFIPLCIHKTWNIMTIFSIYLLLDISCGYEQS